MLKKKTFFREPTAAEIKSIHQVREISDDLVDEILEADEQEALIIQGNLIPGNLRGSRHFASRGTPVKLPGGNIIEALKTKFPFQQQREAAFDDVSARRYNGFSLDPIEFEVDHRDRRVRKFNLVDCLEGARIYGYVHQDWQDGFRSEFTVINVYSIRNCNIKGAEGVVIVPSRTESQRRYPVKYFHLPISNNEHRVGIALQLCTDHSCEDKKYRIGDNAGPDSDPTQAVSFCAHDAAAYLALADYQQDEGNGLLWRLNPFALPQQQAVDFYLRLNNTCLIKTPEDNTIRVLTKQEKEIMLWGLVHKKGYGATFSAEHVRDLKW